MARILVVDDDEGVRETLNLFLQKIGHAAAFCENGTQVLAKAKEFAPGLILLDIDMPKMDGMSLLAILRLEEFTAKTPVLFITARQRIGEAKQAMLLGAQGYLRKPFDFEVLKKEIERLVGSS